MANLNLTDTGIHSSSKSTTKQILTATPQFNMINPYEFAMTNSPITFTSFGGTASSPTMNGTTSGLISIGDILKMTVSGTTKDFQVGGVTSNSTYATFGTLASDGSSSNMSLTNNNLTLNAFESLYKCRRISISKSSGKYYAELKITNHGLYEALGVVPSGTDITGNFYPGLTASTGCSIFSDGNMIKDGTNTGTGLGASTTNDIFMVAIDYTNGRVWFGRNGSWYNSGNPAADTNPSYTGISVNYIAAVAFGSGSSVTINLGSSSYAYTIPSGFSSHPSPITSYTLSNLKDSTGAAPVSVPTAAYKEKTASNFSVVPTVVYTSLGSATADKNSNINTSNNTATLGSVGVQNYLYRSSTPFSSGKYYAEATINTITTNTSRKVAFGIEPATTDFTANSMAFGGSSNGYGLYANDSTTSNCATIALSGSYTSYTGMLVAGDKIMIAVDRDNGRIWFGRNGTWLSGNPSTNTSPSYSSGMTGSYYFGGMLSVTGDQVTWNFGQNAFNYTIPTGFTTLSSSPTPTLGTALTDKNANGTLSNGNLTWTAGSNHYNNIRSTIYKTTGKLYCEFTVVSVPDQTIFGIAPYSFDCTTDNDTNCPAVNGGYAIRNDAMKYYNSSSGSAYGVSFTQGDIVGMAVDLDNGKIYWSKNGVWMNNANPVSGTGYAFNGISGSFYVVMSLYPSGKSATVNFGSTAFAYAPPSGFIGWTSGVGSTTTSWQLSTSSSGMLTTGDSIVGDGISQIPNTVTSSYSGLGSSIIPVMSSFTSGTFTVSASTSQNPAWNACDGNQSTNWSSYTGTYPQWFQVDCGSLKTIRGYSISSDGANTPYSWTLAGSNDGSSWTTVDTQSSVNTGWTAQVSRRFTLSTDATYRYYKITGTAGQSSYFVMQEFNLIAPTYAYTCYMSPPVSVPTTASKVLPATGLIATHANSGLISSGDELYFKSIGSNSLTPVQIGGVSSSGGTVTWGSRILTGITATASSQTGSWGPSNLLDGVTTGTSLWISNSTTACLPAWVQFQLTTAQKVGKYQLAPREGYPQYICSTWQFQASNDGTNWTVLDSQAGLTTGWSSNVMREFVCTTQPSIDYTYYRIYITAMANGDNKDVEISEFALIPFTKTSCSYTLSNVTPPSALYNLPEKAYKIRNSKYNFGVTGSSYATFDTNASGHGTGITLSNGNLTASSNGEVNDSARSSLTFGSGAKIYLEITANGTLDANEYFGIGSSTYNYTVDNALPGVNGIITDYAFSPANGILHRGPSNTNMGTFPSYTTGTWMLAIDNLNGKLYIGHNGTWFNSGDPVGGTGYLVNSNVSGTYYFFVNLYIQSMTVNFGASAWAYTCPSGYTGLSSGSTASSWQLTNATASALANNDTIFADGVSRVVGNVSQSAASSTIQYNISDKYGTPATLTTSILSNGVGWVGASSSTLVPSTGTFAFSVAIGALSGNDVHIGLCSTTISGFSGGLLGSHANTLGLTCNLSYAYNGASQIGSGPSTPANSTVDIIIDRSAGTMSFYRHSDSVLIYSIPNVPSNYNVIAIAVYNSSAQFVASYYGYTYTCTSITPTPSAVPTTVTKLIPTTYLAQGLSNETLCKDTSLSLYSGSIITYAANGNYNLSNGNLTATPNKVGPVSVITSASKSSGKWYAEFTLNNNSIFWGVCNAMPSGQLGMDVGSVGFYNVTNTEMYVDGVTTMDWGHNANDWKIGDKAILALDMDRGMVWCGRNGVWLRVSSQTDPANGLNPAATGRTGSYYFANSLWNTISSVTANFGGSAWAYPAAVPAGFSGMTTQGSSTTQIVSSQSYSLLPYVGSSALNKSIDITVGGVTSTVTPSSTVTETGSTGLDISPTMTGYTTSSFTVTSSIGNGNETNSRWAWQAFNNSSGTLNGCFQIGYSSWTPPGWLSIQCPSAMTISAYTISSITGYPTAAPGTFKLQGCNDGSSWVDLDSRTSITWADAEKKMFILSSNQTYSWYRLYVTANNNTNYLIIDEMELLGSGTYTTTIPITAVASTPTAASIKSKYSTPATINTVSYVNSTPEVQVVCNPITVTNNTSLKKLALRLRGDFGKAKTISVLTTQSNS